MVIVVENGRSKGVGIIHRVYLFVKGMHPIILPLDVGKNRADETP